MDIGKCNGHNGHISHIGCHPDPPQAESKQVKSQKVNGRLVNPGVPREL
jgi:hypothetical protein